MRAIDAIDKVKGENHDQDVGIAIARRAMEEPLRQIAANAGDEPWVVVAKVLEGKGNFGYNAATGEYGDMIAWVYSTQPKSLAMRCTMQHLLVSASVRADVD